jgi:AcrR family transcriptional regulator
MTVTRPLRNREETTARILGAVGSVLARDGFLAVGINAIAKEAGVDEVLIYRYFGGLPEPIAAWGTSGHVWPVGAELLGPDGGAGLRRLLGPPAA